MELRFNEAYQKYVYEFAKDVLVNCPTCNGCAIVLTGDYTVFKTEARGIKLVCSNCGYNKILEDTPTKGNHLLFGAAVDPFFKSPVWLQLEVEGNLLWAYNMEHLLFLESHIAAKLRERTGIKYRVRSIGAKLPRWMTSAKNRKDILKAIDRLKQKYQETVSDA